MSAPAGNGRGASVGGEKTNRVPQLSAVPPPPQVPGIAANSREAFARVPIGKRQQQVLAAINALRVEGVAACDTDDRERLRWPIPWTTPRRRELVEAGRVEQAGDKIGKYGRRVATWRPVAVQLTLEV